MIATDGRGAGRWRRPPALALSLACLLGLGLRARRLGRTGVGVAGVGGSRDRRRALSTSFGPRKRSRPHSSSGTIAIEEGDGKNAVESGGGEGGGGVAARDPHAAQATATPAASRTRHKASTKIIGGVPYPREDHPYIVRLHWSYPGENADVEAPFGSFCGGSLITPNVVLTAAHCLGNHERYVDIYDARLGRPRTYGIERSVLHPGWDDDVFGLDYGLVLLEGTHMEVDVETDDDGEEYWGLKEEDAYDWEDAPPMVRLHRYPNEQGAGNSTNASEGSTAALDTAGPTTARTADCQSLSDDEVEKATTLAVMGYGITSFSLKDGPSDPSYSQLQGADVHYLLNEDCNELYLEAPKGAVRPSKEKGRVITDDMLCAHDRREGQDACSGDSGGPLVGRLKVTAGSSADGSGDGGGSSADTTAMSPNHSNGVTIMTVDKPKSASLWTQVGVVSWGIGCALPKFPGVYSRVAHEIGWIEEAVCGDRRRGNNTREEGLSPKSCVTDENGERHLRDYAAEVALRKWNQYGSPASGVVKGGAILEESTGFEGDSPAKGDTDNVSRREKVQPVHRGKKKKPEEEERRSKQERQRKKEKKKERRRRHRMQACELLEGTVFPLLTVTAAEIPQPITPPTRSPTRSPLGPPTGPPTTGRSMGKERAPTSTSASSTDGSADSPKTCPDNSNSDKDAKSFLVGGNTRREKDCGWVRRKCGKRCGTYGGCCPETCASEKCREK